MRARPPCAVIGCRVFPRDGTWVVGSPEGILLVADHFQLKVNDRDALERAPSDGPVLTAARTVPICEVHTPIVPRLLFEVGPEYRGEPETETGVPRYLGRGDVESQSERTAATFAAVRRAWKKTRPGPRRVRVLGHLVMGDRYWIRAEDADRGDAGTEAGDLV
jgi:hypothetical protein